MQLHGIFAGRVGLVCLRAPFDETIRRERNLLGIDLRVLGVDDADFQWQAFEFSFPIAPPDDAADVNGVAGPIDAALGEKETIEGLLRRGENAFRVEAREIEQPIRTLEGNE